MTSSFAVTTLIGDACFNVNLPFKAVAGTVTTISFSDLLTNSDTSVSPVKTMEVIRSRFVPAMVKLSVCLIEPGLSDVTVGTVTISSAGEAKVKGSVPPVANIKNPVCASIGTFTTTSVVDLLTNSVVVTPSLNVTSSIQLTNVPLIVMFVPGFASGVMDEITTGTSKFNGVFVSMSPPGVLRTNFSGFSSLRHYEFN